MRLGTKAALLGAAMSALTVSGAGSACAWDSHSSHSADAHYFKKSHHAKYAVIDEESSPAPIAAAPIPAPLCGSIVTNTGGDATSEGTGTNTSTGGAATTTATQTTTCNLTINLPAGSDQTVTRTHKEFYVEDSRAQGFGEHRHK